MFDESSATGLVHLHGEQAESRQVVEFGSAILTLHAI
jgi:hypothetical protein